MINDKKSNDSKDNDNILIGKDYTNTLENFDNKLGVISLSGDYFVTGNSLGYVILWKDQVNIMQTAHLNSQAWQKKDR